MNMESLMIRKDANITQQELLEEIAGLNQDTSVDGILVQLPLPKHIDESKVLRAIEPTKDVDGFHPDNIARLFLGEDGLVPCTPKGMMVMLEQIGYDLTGKQVVVVGPQQHRRETSGSIGTAKQCYSDNCPQQNKKS